MGHTHIRLARASEDVVKGALRTAWKLGSDKNAAKQRKGHRQTLSRMLSHHFEGPGPRQVSTYVLFQKASGQDAPNELMFLTNVGEAACTRNWAEKFPRRRCW